VTAVTRLVQAALDTLRNPREGARKVMALDLPRRARWDILMLIAIVSAGFAYLSFALNARLGNLVPGTELMSPFMMAVAQILVLWMMVYAIYLVGRAMGGTGSLDDTILLVAWMQGILIGLQVLQIIAALVFPLASVLLGFAGFIILFWLLTVFTAELHGFRSTAAVFFSVLIVMVVLSTILRAVFSMFGYSIVGVI